MIQEVVESIKRKPNERYLDSLKNATNFINKSFYLKSEQFSLPKYTDINYCLDTEKDNLELIKLQVAKELIIREKLKKISEEETFLKRRISHLTVNKKEKIDAIQKIQVLQQDKRIRPSLFIMLKEPSKLKTPEKTSPKDKRKNKIKEKVINDMLLDFPFNLFKFKTMSECQSKETSKPYYISKKDMLQVIEDNHELKVKFPKGYKALKKEKICEVIFKK